MMGKSSWDIQLISRRCILFLSSALFYSELGSQSMLSCVCYDLKPYLYSLRFMYYQPIN